MVVVCCVLECIYLIIKNKAAMVVLIPYQFFGSSELMAAEMAFGYSPRISEIGDVPSDGISLMTCFAFVMRQAWLNRHDIVLLDRK